MMIVPGSGTGSSRYRDAGHLCAGVPGTPAATETPPHPLTGVRYSLGGTQAGNARARADSWPRVAAFLHDALAPAHDTEAGRCH